MAATPFHDLDRNSEALERASDQPAMLSRLLEHRRQLIDRLIEHGADSDGEQQECLRRAQDAGERLRRRLLAAGAGLREQLDDAYRVGFLLRALGADRQERSEGEFHG
jgi:hypothetical protein